MLQLKDRDLKNGSKNLTQLYVVYQKKKKNKNKKKTNPKYKETYRLKVNWKEKNMSSEH